MPPPSWWTTARSRSWHHLPLRRRGGRTRRGTHSHGRKARRARPTRISSGRPRTLSKRATSSRAGCYSRRCCRECSTTGSWIGPEAMKAGRIVAGALLVLALGWGTSLLAVYLFGLRNEARRADVIIV